MASSLVANIVNRALGEKRKNGSVLETGETASRMRRASRARVARRSNSFG